MNVRGSACFSGAGDTNLRVKSESGMKGSHRERTGDKDQRRLETKVGSEGRVAKRRNGAGSYTQKIRDRCIVHGGIICGSVENGRLGTITGSRKAQ